jgi:hypothetical protein
MKFKKGAKIISDDFYYDLNAGYINLEDILIDEHDIIEINTAIDILVDFQNELIKKKILEEI